MKYPRSAYDKVGGMVYFGRMLDKIRLFAAGELGPDYLPFRGKGFDGRCTRYLHVDYALLAEQVNLGGSDEEIFQWCAEHGRKLNEEEIAFWNAYATKRGWKDDGTPGLEKNKQDSGLADRADIETYFQYYEVDEKRKP